MKEIAMKAKSGRLGCKTDFSAWLEEVQYGSDVTHTSPHSWSLSSGRVSLSSPLANHSAQVAHSFSSKSDTILPLESCCPALAWATLSSITFHEWVPELLLALYPSGHLVDPVTEHAGGSSRVRNQAESRDWAGQDVLL